MKSFKQFISEMAPPRDADKGKVYYHGTPSEKYIEGIIQNGIQPPTMSSSSWGTNHYLKPVEGKVYITPSLRYAIIYALGGDYVGSDYSPRNYESEPYGYVCVIDGKDVHDIQPDEDCVGEMVYKGEIPWLKRIADIALDDEMYEDTDSEDDDYSETIPLLDAVKRGEYDAWAYAGKLILPYLSDEQKLELIDAGAHIAHTGAIIPSQIWRFDKLKSKELRREHNTCSNFFELAERIR